MKEKIEACFDALQALDIRPTPTNVSILNGVYEHLRAVYNELEEGKENAEPRATVDSE